MGKVVKYYKDARQRAKRRKSSWNWVLLPFAIIGIGGAWFLLERGVFTIQRYLIPVNAILSGRTRVSGVLMFDLLFFPSLVLGFMFANFVTWCIPPARRALEGEAKGVKGASFKKAMKLLSIVSTITLLVVAPISLWGAFNYFYVTTDGVHINPLFSFKERHYKWSDIVRIESRCYMDNRDVFEFNYLLHMKDRTKIDLFEEIHFFKSVDKFDEIKSLIKAYAHQIDFRYSIGKREIEKIRRYYPKDAEKIIKFIRGED